jgi:hypothetical protein
LQDCRSTWVWRLRWGQARVLRNFTHKASGLDRQADVCLQIVLDILDQNGTTINYELRGLSRVDWKSTIINDVFIFLFLDILLNHLISAISRVLMQVATSPKIFTTKLFHKIVSGDEDIP